MKRSRLVLAALAVLVLVAWQTEAWRPGAERTGERDPASAPGGGNRTAERRSGALAGAPARSAWIPPARLDGAVTISGTVLDMGTLEGVGGVEVVFRSEAGEETTIAGADGRYRIDVPAGTYRAFVRDDTVLSVGPADHVRLPELPTAEAAGAPDEALMPVVVAAADMDGVDLTVRQGGMLRGQVVDLAGRPVASAVVRARARWLRPTLGTDVAETASDGTFELRLPRGIYEVEVSHPRFAGLGGPAADGRLEIEAGEVQRRTFTLAAGCVIAGRVVGPGGRRAGEGAIEQQWGSGDHQFAPAGRIAADGTFRWTTTEETEVVLRAWPWKSPPSPARSFTCRDGARHEGVVFSLPDRGPDLDGLLVDRGGAPVALAYVDLAPLDPGGMAQQERTDEQGRWSVFELPAGRYLVTAYAAGRGVVATTVTVPQIGVRLQLGGTGRIEGRTPQLARGSFELGLLRCDDGEAVIRLPAERRLVTIKDHAFTIEDVPACNLQMITAWRDRDWEGEVEVPAGGAAPLELDLGSPGDAGDADDADDADEPDQDGGFDAADA
jgi:hypothetical protein